MPARLSPLRRALRPLRRRAFPGSARYWDRRYRRGRTSGLGSDGAHRRFKADFLNGFVAQQGVRTVLEFGCGDGNQLALAEYPEYLGLDVSPTAVSICSERYANDPTKQFRLYDPATFDTGPSADLTLSLDVILHLVEDRVFDQHLAHVFGASRSHVIAYGSDVDLPISHTAAHVRFRRFTPLIEQRFPQWDLVEIVRGLEPATPDGPRTDFFVYRSA